MTRSLIDWWNGRPAKKCLITADFDGIIVGAYGDTKGVCGWKSTDLIGKPLVAMIPSKYRALHLHGMQRFMETGQAPALGLTFDAEAMGADGVDRPMSLTVFGADSNVRLIFGLLERRRK